MVLTLEQTTNRPLVDLIPDDGRPDLARVLSMEAQATDYFRGFHKQCEEEDEYYFGTKKIPVPEGMNIDPVRPATAFAIVNIATDHVDVNNLAIDVPLMPRSRARAEKLKKYYQGVWLSIKKPVLRTSVRHAFQYGLGWLSPRYLPNLYPDAPLRSTYDTEEQYKEALGDFQEKRRIAFPLDCLNINPKNMLWDDSRTGPRWAIYKVQSQVGDLRHQYPEWAKKRGQTSIVNFMEYWDEEWAGFIADNEWVWGPERHGYGFLPFIPILPANSIDWDADRPEMRYRGILKPVHSLLDAEARVTTQMEAILRKHAWTTLDFSPETSRQAAEDSADDYDIFSGKNVLNPGVRVSVSPVPPLPPDLIGHLGTVQTMIEEATFPNVVRGIRPKGISAGFALSVLAGVGKLVFQGVADGTSRAVERCNSGFASMVENLIQGPVTVHARSEIHQFDQTIGPDDIRGYHENIVTLKAEAPEEREREALLARQLFMAGIISKYEAQRRAGIVNPLEEQDQIAAEQLLELLRPEQAEALKQKLGLAGGGVAAEVAGAVNEGNRFLPNMPQLQRPGEANNQRARIASRAGQPSVFPQGLSGIEQLGNRLGGPAGGAVGVPSGQTVR
jgi:hypothetical protein